MILTQEQQDIYDGKQGEALAKVMKSLVAFGDTFGAEKLVPVTSDYGHLVTSFGLGVCKPVYKIMDELIDGGVVSKQKFSMDPRPLDKNVPKNLLQDLIFKFMYSKQADYEVQLEKIGLLDKDAFTCACYFDEVGNQPKKGDILSWAESSAVVYANSVLGARCNRNSGIFEMFGSIAGYVPYFGLLTDEGRKATWKVYVKTTKLPPAQVLGSAIGMKVMEAVPYVYGLDTFLGKDLNNDVKSYLKDFGAATASNGAVGLYHIDGLTPEAVELGESLICDDAETYVIDDAEIERVIASYPCIWKDKDAAPKMAFVGCPHMTLTQLVNWTDNVAEELKKNGKKKVAVKTVFTTAPGVLKEFNKLPQAEKAKKMGITVSYICPLMYMNNPLCGKMPVITNSNKLRTYTTCRYYTDDVLLKKITGGAQ